MEHLANGLITAGLHTKVLVIRAETLLKVNDYNSRNMDGEQPVFLASHLGGRGEGGIHLYRTGLSNRMGGKERRTEDPLPLK